MVVGTVCGNLKAHAPPYFIPPFLFQCTSCTLKRFEYAFAKHYHLTLTRLSVLWNHPWNVDLGGPNGLEPKDEITVGLKVVQLSSVHEHCKAAQVTSLADTVASTRANS